jgi:hypothetical protein
MMSTSGYQPVMPENTKKIELNKNTKTKLWSFGLQRETYDVRESFH